MAFKVFGFTFGKENQASAGSQFVTPNAYEPSYDIVGNGFISPTATASTLNNIVKTENSAISEYRDVSREPEVDMAVEEIVSEMFVFDHDRPIVSLNLDDVDMPDTIKEVLANEFVYLLGLLDFNQNCHNIAKRWYIDGRLNYLININEAAPQEGITQLQYIDPYKIKRIREIERGVKDGTPVIKSIKEYYLFNENGIDNTVTMSMGVSNNPTGTIPLTLESVAHTNSGLYDPERGFVMSYLEYAIKSVNSLRSVEESQIIYTMTRAPERRVFYVDTGNLSQAKAKQYIKEISDQYRTKIVYDPVTGKIKSDKRFLSMTEDFWIPRSGGGRGTEIDTLPAGDAFSSMEQAEYYKNKLWEALKVPASRFNTATFISRGTEITRDELRFYKRVQMLRMKFNHLFLQLLERHLILKAIIDVDDWEHIKDNIRFDYAVDNYFAEAVDNEIMQTRLGILAAADQFCGKYYGEAWVYKHVLHVRDEDIDEYKKDAKKANINEMKRQQMIQRGQASTQMQIEADEAEFQQEMQQSAPQSAPQEAPEQEEQPQQ